MINLIHGDCLEKLKDIPNKSIDFILTDPPYGTTQCKWDVVIPLDLMWVELNRVIKDNGAIALFSSQPFTTILISSNIKAFRYEWIWEKQKGSDPLNANRKPLKAHENIIIFYKKSPKYSPQFSTGVPYIRKGNCKVKSEINRETSDIFDRGSSDGKRYPKTVIKFSSEGMNSKNLHPTQKPVALLEYLIKTYTLENETVLDFTMGSGSTGVACKNLNRKFIGIEKDNKYFEIAKNRIENHIVSLPS